MYVMIQKYWNTTDDDPFDVEEEQLAGCGNADGGDAEGRHVIICI